MSRAYRSFFGFVREPFCSEIQVEEILQTEAVLSVLDRVDYTIRLGAMAMVTGEVGSGKSTALRFATSRLHPSEYRLLWITAGGGSILELYRQLAWELEVETSAFSRAALTHKIRQAILELVQGKKQKVVLLIDEASLKCLPNYIPSRNLRETPNPFCPSFWPGKTIFSTNFTGRRRCPCPLGSWQEVISRRSTDKAWQIT